MNGILISLGEQEPLIRNKVAFLFCLKQIMYEVGTKIQQTKMLVTCQRFDDLFLFGLVWQYSSAVSIVSNPSAASNGGKWEVT